MCDTCLGWLLCYVAFSVGMSPVDGDWPFNGGGGGGGQLFCNVFYVPYILYILITSYYMPDVLS